MRYWLSFWVMVSLTLVGRVRFEPAMNRQMWASAGHVYYNVGLPRLSLRSALGNPTYYYFLSGCSSFAPLTTREPELLFHGADKILSHRMENVDHVAPLHSPGRMGNHRGQHQ
jgi:hypothetical protein